MWWCASSRLPTSTSKLQAGSCPNAVLPHTPISLPAYAYDCLLLGTVLHLLPGLLLHAHGPTPANRLAHDARMPVPVAPSLLPLRRLSLLSNPPLLLLLVALRASSSRTISSSICS